MGLALSRSVRALVALAALGGAAPGVVTTCAKAGGEKQGTSVEAGGEETRVPCTAEAIERGGQATTVGAAVVGLV